MTTLGFIILRYVSDSHTNFYWMHSYDCIRRYYKENTIMIIDDCSDYNFITSKELYKTHIIQSEYPRRGELLPYYYYLHNKLFDKAVIIHDSVFINKYIDYGNIDKYKMLWSFEHDWDNAERELEIINAFNCSELSNYYNSKHLWKGCFGCMSVITHDYLAEINSKYEIRKLLEYILNRNDRCCLERVIGCLLQINDNKDISKDMNIDRDRTLLGDLHVYGKQHNNMIRCLADAYRYSHMHLVLKLPLLKIYTGR